MWRKPSGTSLPWRLCTFRILREKNAVSTVAAREPTRTQGMRLLLADKRADGRWVLDPAGSRVEFRVKHFWGLITVHGSFGQMAGEGRVDPDGAISGRVTIDASSLSTKNARRDEDLRSARFFDVAHHRELVIRVAAAKPAGPARLEATGTLEVAGISEPLTFTAELDEASLLAVTLRAELTVDRSMFDMTWSPLGMASMAARGTVVARFVRPSTTEM